MQFNDSIAKEPQWVRGQWMQPSLTTLLQIASAKLTANSDLIKHYHEDSGIHFGLLTLYTMASSSTFTTCTKWVTQPYFNPSSHGLTWSSGRPTAICFWPMLTSNLSHCLRNPGKVLRLDGLYASICQPNTKHAKGNFERCSAWGIHFWTKPPSVHPVLHQLPCFLALFVDDQGFHHAANGDGCWLHVMPLPSKAGHRSLRGKTGQKKLGMGGRWGFLLLTCRLEMDGNGNVWFQHVSAATKVSQDKHLSLVIGSQYWQLSGTKFLNSNHNWYSLWIQLNYMLNSIIELYWIIMFIYFITDTLEQHVSSLRIIQGHWQLAGKRQLGPKLTNLLVAHGPRLGDKYP